MLVCYAETDSLFLESFSVDGLRKWASFGTGDDADDSLEASADDIREFSGKSCLGFADVVSLLGIQPEPIEESGLWRYVSFRILAR